MSYQVLARKWRPKSFREMVGQEHVLKALINALDHGRLHHAYLFTGTRGVGKTTLARILAKSLNCETGISSEPCGQCSACLEINEGRFVDLIEVDAASRTKVEDTRELLENVQYAPTRGRFKVYLIDEVHMLSGHSFNALLKTLEEPPEHVKFLLATTDPQKLPITILSRCLQFNLKAMTPERIVGHLKNVLAAEMVEFEEPALWQLGRAADGSMRDSLSLTDQAIAFGNGKVLENEVRDMLGSIDREYVFGLLEAMAQEDPKALLDKVAQLAEQGPDYSALLADLITTLHRMSVAQLVPDAVDDSDGDRQRVIEFAQRFAPEQLQLFYQTGLHGRRDLALAPNARTGFEMTLLRMLLFKPQGSLPAQAPTKGAPQPGKVSSPVAAGQPSSPDSHSTDIPQRSLGQASDHLSAMKQALSGKDSAPEKQANPMAAKPSSAPKSEPSAGKEPSASKEPSAGKEPSAHMQPPANKQPSAGQEPSTDKGHSATNTPSFSGSQSAAVATPTLKTNSPRKVSVVRLNDPWADLVGVLELDGPVRNFARNCALASQKDDVWTLAISPRFEALYKTENSQLLEQAIGSHLQKQIRLEVNFVEPASATPDQLLASYKQKKLDQAISLLKNDPFVQDLQTLFGASLDEKSVQARDS